MAGLELPFGIFPVNPVYVDGYRGPYVDVATAIATVPEPVRVIGQVVYIYGESKEYWWKDSISDAGLVEKIAGSLYNIYDVDTPQEFIQALNATPTDGGRKTININSSIQITKAGFPSGFNITNPTEVDILGEAIIIVTALPPNDLSIDLGGTSNINFLNDQLSIIGVGGGVSLPITTFGGSILRVERLSVSNSTVGEGVLIENTSVPGFSSISYERISEDDVGLLPTSDAKKSYWKNTNRLELDDAVTNTDDTWSSTKIASEIASVVGITNGDKGDIVVSNTGATWTIDNLAIGTAKIANQAVDNAKLSAMLGNRIKGRIGTTGGALDLTGTQATTILDTFTSTLKGLVPASGGGTDNFLRADGTWTAVGGGITDGDKGDITVSDSGSSWTIDNDVVTFDKIQNIPTNRVLARSSSGNGSVEELTLPNFRTLINVEDGATADQTDAEIETAYNNQVSVVSQVDAEAGTSTTAQRWTPQRVKQAIDALGASTTYVPVTNEAELVSALESVGDKHILIMNELTIANLSASSIVDVKTVVGSDLIITNSLVITGGGTVQFKNNVTINGSSTVGATCMIYYKRLSGTFSLTNQGVVQYEYFDGTFSSIAVNQPINTFWDNTNGLTIDDSAINTFNTWSSFKISDEMKTNYSTEYIASFTVPINSKGREYTYNSVTDGIATVQTDVCGIGEYVIFRLTNSGALSFTNGAGVDSILTTSLFDKLELLNDECMIKRLPDNGGNQVYKLV